MNINIFKRHTSSKSYIPELDGLRFLAIVSVLIYHTNNRLSEAIPNYENFLTRFFKAGFLGVEIFFAISGYILSVQVLHLLSKDKFTYKEYFKKRLRRIEPPFLISTIAIFSLWYYFGSTPKHDLINSLLSVITYTSNIVGTNLINVVTWSLEIEIQFYLLLPLFLFLYVKSPKIFYILFASIFLFGFFAFNYSIIPFKLLPSYTQYFLIGIVVAILSKKEIFVNTYFFGCNLLLVFFIFFLGLNFTIIAQLLIVILILILFNNVLILKKGINFFKLNLVAIVGGMCYTIYLWHYPIMSIFFRNIFGHIKILNLNEEALYWICIIGLTSFQIMVSFFLFILFEKPFMKQFSIKLKKK
jgi:peptidoglycan/LPS O-acetylase OafA/YrhL